MITSIMNSLMLQWALMSLLFVVVGGMLRPRLPFLSGAL